MGINRNALLKNVKGRGKSNKSARSTGTRRALIEEACILADGHYRREPERSSRVTGATFRKPARGREGTATMVRCESGLIAVNLNEREHTARLDADGIYTGT